MRIRHLGTGTAASGNNLVSIFVDWDHDGRKHNLLFECPPDVVSSLRQIDVPASNVERLAVTRRHPNTWCLPALVEAYREELELCGIDPERDKHWELGLYLTHAAHNNVFGQLAGVYEQCSHAGPPLPKLYPNVDMTKVGSVELPGATLTAFPVFCEHERVDALAFRLELKTGETFAYADAGMDPNSSTSAGILQAAHQADHLVLRVRVPPGEEEIAYRRGALTPRMACNLAHMAQARTLTLTGLPTSAGHSEVGRDCSQSRFGGELKIA